MKIIVTGGRDYPDEQAVFKALDNLAPSEIAHGGCPTGADKWAHAWAQQTGVKETIYPANWKSYGLSAGPRRNAEMVANFGADMVLAFPGGRGTTDTVSRAKRAGIRVVDFKEAQ